MKRWRSMSTHATLTLALSVALGAALSGCGGGSDNYAGSTTSYAVSTAWFNLYDVGHAWALGGSLSVAANGGATTTYPATGGYTVGAVADAVFPYNGINAHVLRTTVSLTASGSTSATTTDQYLDANLTYMGSLDSNGYCQVASSSALPPATAMIGSSGPIAQFTVYTDCAAGASVVATGTTNWSLEQQGGQSFFCLSTQTGYASGNDTEKDCFVIDPNGHIGSQASVRVTSVSATSVATLALDTP